MKVVDHWRAIDPAWKFALSAYLVARLALAAWSLIIALLFPTVLQNLDLFGVPVLATFDLASSARYVYSREVAGATLTFRVDDPGQARDAQTGSVWSLRDGRAVSGKYAGQTLTAAVYSAEQVFPYLGVAPERNILLALWQRFDTNWYLLIAQRGYADDGSKVYLPMYPLLIRAVTALVGDSLVAALLVSNLALIGALIALHRLTETLFDAASARRAAAYLLLFPAGFFLLAAYTESLFLFFALSAFVFAKRGQWSIAALFGALAALTRLQGVLLIVPLGWMWWEQTFPLRPSPNRRRVGGEVIALLVIPLATAAFLAFTSLSLVTTYEGQLHARFVMPWDNVWAAMALLANGRGSWIDALNLLAMLGAGAMVIVIWQKLPREYGLYVLAMFLAPLFRMTTTQPLVSMTRYVLAIFPLFMLWGAWGKHAWVNRAVVYMSFPLQLFLSAQFVMWGWVG